MANPYVFIVGCPRSGTTLLQRMADAHPLLAVMHESKWFDKRWIVEWLDSGRGLTSEGFVTPCLISRMVEHPKFSRLKMEGGKLLELLRASDPLSYADFITRLFDSYGLRKGKSLVGNNTPAYVRRLQTLHELWPEARFVHLIRDGRDVCLSVVPWSKGPIVNGKFVTSKDHPTSTAALWWALNVQLGRQAGHLLGPKLYYELRYESLVSNPEEECKGLCTFLGLPYDEAMLRFHEGRTKADPDLDAESAWRPITPGLRDWRSQMPAEDVEQFEAAAGDLLDELGYPRAVMHPRPEALGHAGIVRYALTRDPYWIQVISQGKAKTLAPASKISDSKARRLGIGASLAGRA